VTYVMLPPTQGSMTADDWIIVDGHKNVDRQRGGSQRRTVDIVTSVDEDKTLATAVRPLFWGAGFGPPGTGNVGCGKLDKGWAARGERQPRRVAVNGEYAFRTVYLLGGQESSNTNRKGSRLVAGWTQSARRSATWARSSGPARWSPPRQSASAPVTGGCEAMPPNGKRSADPLIGQPVDIAISRMEPTWHHRSTRLGYWTWAGLWMDAAHGQEVAVRREERSAMAKLAASRGVAIKATERAIQTWRWG